MHTETKGEKDKGARACHMLMTSQRTKEGGTGINKRGFPGIMREAQLGITLSLPVIDEEDVQIPNKITKVWAPYMAKHAGFEVNANLFIRIDSKGFIK